MGLTCRCCKIDLPPRAKECHNCKRYFEAMQRQYREMEEEELCKVYWCLPMDWYERDDWRNDPFFFKGGEHDPKSRRKMETEKVTEQVTEHQVQADAIKIENCEIVKCGPHDWNYKVFLDGIEQKRVYHIELELEVESLPRLTLHRYLLSEEHDVPQN